jgi:hypothetical protein
MQLMVIRGIKVTGLLLTAAATIGAVKPMIGEPEPPLHRNRPCR